MRDDRRHVSDEVDDCVPETWKPGDGLGDQDNEES